MTKQIQPNELAEIVSALILCPEKAGQINDRDTYLRFLQDAAQLVTDYCGGYVSPSPVCNNQNDPDANILIPIHPNECLPEGEEGIWENYDPEGWDQFTRPSAEQIKSYRSKLRARISEVFSQKLE